MVFFSGTLLAQQSSVYTHELTEFNRAVELYKDKQYQAAQILFDKVKSKTDNMEVESDCAYYIANCAIRLNQSDADQKMESFVENYPTSTKQNQAYIEVAHYYFEQGKYPQSMKWFDKVDESTLSQDDRDKYNFQKGYTFFTAGNKKEASNYFNQVLNSKEYGSQAKYYLGFMAYESDDYTNANKLFDEVSGEEKYKEKMSYFQADMNFKLGKFDKAIDLGKAAMAKSNAQEKSELNKIIGESYFNLKQYDKAMQRYDQLLQLAIAQQDQANLYFAYLGLASTSKDNEKLDAALAYIEKAEQYLPGLQSTYQNSMHHYEKALIYRELGQISLASQELAQAEQSLNKEENPGNQSSLLWILNLKARLEADSGRYQKAYEHLDQFFKGYHKLRNKEHELAVEKLRLGFDVQRQQAQNELLAKDNELQALRLQEAERKRQNQWLWIGLFGCTSLVLLVLLLWQLARRQAQLQATIVGPYIRGGGR